VTLGQFQAYVKETGYKTAAETDGKGGGTFDGSQFILRPEANWKVPGIIQGSDRHPVTQVTWNDAQELCRWLSKKEGRTYRLPTEAEWEFACRAGTKTPYACGEALTRRDANYEGSTVPVGSFRPNAFGLHEMHSNVMEWCADYFGHRAYVHSEPVDPTGPVEGTKRVHRSGSWGDFPEKCRSASRGGYEPDYRHYGLGFRVVCDVSAKVTGEIAADDGTRVTLEQLVALARAKLDRNRKLHEMSSVSTMELAESEIELKNAEIRLATAKGDRKGVLSLLEELVKLRQANLDRARRLVEKNALAKADEAEFEKALTEDRFRLEQARKEAAAP
jgi:hypothetical protein